MRRIIPVGVFVAAAALASQVSFNGLESDARLIKRVLAVKVVSVKRWQDHLKLRDGSEGPVTKVHVEATCDVERVLRGTFAGKRIVVKHQLMSGNQYDADGKVVLTASYSMPGSGLEQQLKEGERYVFGLQAPVAGEAVDALFRADPPDGEKAMLQAVDAAADAGKR